VLSDWCMKPGFQSRDHDDDACAASRRDQRISLSLSHAGTVGREIATEAFLEWAWVHGERRYGNAGGECARTAGGGQSLAINLDVQGVESLRRATKNFPRWPARCPRCSSCSIMSSSWPASAARAGHRGGNRAPHGDGRGRGARSAQVRLRDSQAVRVTRISRS